MIHDFAGPGRRWAVALMTVFFVTACRAAESRDDPAGEPVLDEIEVPSASDEQTMSPAVAIAPGTRMTFQLLSTLSTETNRSGDRFHAALVQDVNSPSGDLLLPSGTHANGVVEVARPSPSAGEPAVLHLRLESVEVDGVTVPLAASVVDAQAKAETRDSGGETAAKIAVGTAAGAVVGRILGKDRKGALIGAGAGAVAGTVFAVTTDDGHATIHHGSTVTVVLDEPLQVR